MQENRPDAGIMRQKIIIVDLDGTLLDDRERHYRCYRDIITLLGGEPLALDEYIALKRSKKSTQAILSLSQVESFTSQFSKMFLERIEAKEYLAHEVLRPDAVKFMDIITGMGMKLMLATMRNNKENMLWQLRHLGIYEYFKERILCGSKRETRKKDLMHCQIQGVVGDTEEDEAMARNLETIFFGVLSGMREKRFLQADYFVENLNEIPVILRECMGAQ